MRTILRIAVFVAGLMMWQSAAAQTYCTPIINPQGCWIGDDINSFTMGTLSDLNTGCPGNGYEDRTSLSAPIIIPGTSQSFTVTSTNTFMFYAIYIDLNSDGDFQDANEFVWNSLSASSVTSTTASFLVPTGSGTRRMRVKGKSQATPITQAQECTWGWGETHDYNVLLSTSGCLPPTNITASLVSGTSATINYNSAGTSFEIDYGTIGHTGGTGTIVTSTTTNKALTGLTANTAYHVFVRNICSGTSQSSWNGPFLLTTRCETNSVFPYTETFDNTPWLGVAGPGGFGDGISNCWVRNPDVYNLNNMFITRTGATSSTNSGPNNGYSGSGNYMHVMNTFTTGSVALLELPQQNLTSLTSPELTFYYHMFGAGMGKVIVEASTNGGVSWVKLDSIVGQQQTAKSAAWLPRVVSLNSVKTAFTQIRFKTVANTSNGDLCIDQVSIANPPPCPNPNGTGITNILGTGATLNWNFVAGNSYFIEYGAQGFAQGTGALMDTVTNAGTFVMTGLNGETYYDAYLKVDCGINGMSGWVGPFTFRTHAVPNWVDAFAPFLPDNRWMKAQGTLANPTSFTLLTNSNWTTDGYLNVGTTGAARVGVYSSGTRNDWFMTKTTDLGTGNNYELHFDAGLTANGTTFASSMAPNDKLRVVISTDNGLTWNLSNVIFDITPTTGISNLGSTYTVSLAGYSGLVKFGFYLDRPVASSFQYDFFIDNVGVRTPLPCPPPTAVATGTITQNSIAFTWNGGTGTGTYSIEYGPVGFVQGTGGTIISGIATAGHTVTGLTPMTNYQFYFRKDCNSLNTSTWVGPITVRSGCPDVFATPYLATFDELPNGYPDQGNFENCWSTNQPSTVFHWRTVQTTTGTPNTGPQADHTQGAGQSGKYMVANALYTGTQTDLIAGPFNLSTLTQPTLKFYYFMYGSHMGNMYVDISTDGVVWQQNVVSYKGQKQASATAPWGEAQVALSQYIGDTVYLRFRAERGNGIEGNIAIDDVSIANAVGCISPAGIITQSVAATSATLTWATYQPATSVEYGLTGYLQGFNKIATLHNVSSTATLSALLPGTVYDFYVRDTCNPTVWVGPHTFNTPCVAPLNGVYTIGGTPGASNFTTLANAINTLNTCGVAGPVVFNFTGGSHVGFYNLGAITGASSVNTIEFVGTLGADSIVSTTFDYIVQLSGTQHVSFKNITFYSASDNYLVWLRNQAQHITFENCEFVTDPTNSFSSALLVASGNAANPNVVGNNANYITVDNCLFKNGYYGVSLLGDVVVNATDFTMINNTFMGQYQSSVNIRQANNVLIENNTLNNSNGSTNGYGIYLLGVNNALVNANHITVAGDGILIANSGTSTQANTVTNNMLIASGYGLSFSGCNNLNVYHNTASGNGIACYFSGTSNLVDVRNNIFSSNVNLAFSSQNAIANLTLNYNIYNRLNTGTLALYVVTYSDLATWKTGQPTLNINSLQGNPNFVSGTDLHVYGQLANNAGVNIATVTADFDGDTRPLAPSTTVDIGADEYTPKLIDASVLALYEPIFNCGSTSTNVSVIVKNFGATTITSLPVTVMVSGGLTANLSGTYTVNLPFGAVDTIAVGTINTSNLSSAVTFTAYPALVNDEDSSNDTLVRAIEFIPVQPVAGPQIAVCKTATADTLSALPIAGVTYGWFASQAATTPVDTGNTFAYGPNAQSSWYLGYAPLAFDQLLTSNSLANSHNGGIMFNVEAKKNVAIDSINVVSAFPPNTNFNLEVYYIVNSTVAGNQLTPSNWVLHETQIVTGLGFGQNIALNTPINIPQGATYAIYLFYPSYTVEVSSTQPQVYSNSSIKVTPGNALLGKFYYTIPDQQFSGTIYTHETSCSTNRTLVQTQFRTDTAVASFTTAISQPNKVDVDASASQGQLVEWNFGDGTTATGTLATHFYTAGGTYVITCVVTDTDCGTVDTSYFTVQMAIGVDENALANSVTVYPNPSQGVFNLRMNVAGTTDVTLVVVDARGKTIESRQITDGGNDIQIDLSGHPSGLYFAQLQIGNQLVVKKLSKL